MWYTKQESEEHAKRKAARKKKKKKEVISLSNLTRQLFYDDRYSMELLNLIIILIAETSGIRIEHQYKFDSKLICTNLERLLKEDAPKVATDLSGLLLLHHTSIPISVRNKEWLNSIASIRHDLSYLSKYELGLLGITLIKMMQPKSEIIEFPFFPELVDKYSSKKWWQPTISFYNIIAIIARLLRDNKQANGQLELFK